MPVALPEIKPFRFELQVWYRRQWRSMPGFTEMDWLTACQEYQFFCDNYPMQYRVCRLDPC